MHIKQRQLETEANPSPALMGSILFYIPYEILDRKPSRHYSMRVNLWAVGFVEKVEAEDIGKAKFIPLE